MGIGMCGGGQEETASDFSTLALVLLDKPATTAALGINRAGCRVFEGSNFERNEKPKQPRPISFASSGTDSTSEVALVELADETITHEATPIGYKTDAAHPKGGRDEGNL